MNVFFLTNLFEICRLYSKFKNKFRWPSVGEVDFAIWNFPNIKQIVRKASIENCSWALIRSKQIPLLNLDDQVSSTFPEVLRIFSTENNIVLILTRLVRFFLIFVISNNTRLISLNSYIFYVFFVGNGTCCPGRLYTSPKIMLSEDLKTFFGNSNESYTNLRATQNYSNHSHQKRKSQRRNKILPMLKKVTFIKLF